MPEAQRYGSGKEFVDEMFFSCSFILNMLVFECFCYRRFQEIQEVLSFEE